MAITKIFKGLSDRYGTFAYMENDELVVGENWPNKTIYSYRGSIEAFKRSGDLLKLAARNRALAEDIIDYSHKKEKNKEDAMDTVEDIIKRLWQHNKNYKQGKTQDFEQVFKDCLAAADMLYKYKNSEITEALTAGVVVESKPTKLCEIKVTEGADSLKELVFQLTANGYRVDVAPVYKEFPKTGLDYWMIAIFDKEEK
jgi:hypothetical protein